MIWENIKPTLVVAPRRDLSCYLELTIQMTRVAFITGGAQGIGEAIALRLAQDGLDVAILDVRGKEDQMQAVTKKINELGRRSHWVVGDVSDETSVKNSVESVVQTLGSLDVVRSMWWSLAALRGILTFRLANCQRRHCYQVREA